MSTVRIQIRRGTASDWSTVNPTLAAGELGVETNTRKIKIGDGSTAWNSLSYIAADSPAISEIAQDAINDALSMGSGLTKSYNDNGNTISISIDDSVVALRSYVDSAVGGLQNTVESDYVLVSDVGNAGGPAKLDVDGNLLVPKSSIILEGSSADDYETTLTVTNPTADRTITFPNASGTVALTSDITAAVDGLVDSAPGALDTLNELAAALGDDANYATTITNALGGKLSLSGGTMTGDITLSGGPTANLHPATKKYVDDIVVVINDAGLNHTQSSNVHGFDLTTFAVTATVNQKIEDDIFSAITEHTDVTENVHGIADTTDLLLKSGGTMTGNLTLNGAPSYDLQASTKKYVDDEIVEHAAITQNVHGIADTAALATTSYVDAADSDLQDNIDLKAPIESPTFTGTVSGITATMVGLGNVDNTSDANKPVSTATQTALDLKADLAGPTFTGTTTTDDLVINGDLTLNGDTFSASATSIVIEDNILQLAHENAANTVDLGLVVSYNDGTQKHAGLVKDTSASKWKLFKDVTTEPATTVDFTQGSLDDLQVKDITAENVTATTGVIFTDGTQTKEGVPSRTPIISKTGSYTLSSLTERDSLIEVDSSSEVTITIPTNSAVAFPVGTTLDILGTNTGLITIAGDTGVTVNATPGLKLRTQWSSCTLFKRGENAWVVYGDLKA